jgi:hypothetical protein
MDKVQNNKSLLQHTILRTLQTYHGNVIFQGFSPENGDSMFLQNGGTY